MTKREDITFDRIKVEILGQSGSLIVVTNANFYSQYIVAYRFTSADLKADKDLRYILFGRLSTKHALKIDKLCCNGLSKSYKKYLIDFVATVDKFGDISTHDNINFGYVAEQLLVDTGYYKKSSDKQDKQKIDVISTRDNTRSQVKCSIIKPNSHSSAGTTNGRA